MSVAHLNFKIRPPTKFKTKGMSARRILFGFNLSDWAESVRLNSLIQHSFFHVGNFRCAPHRENFFMSICQHCETWNIYHLRFLWNMSMLIDLLFPNFASLPRFSSLHFFWCTRYGTGVHSSCLSIYLIICVQSRKLCLRWLLSAIVLYNLQLFSSSSKQLNSQWHGTRSTSLDSLCCLLVIKHSKYSNLLNWTTNYEIFWTRA